MKDDHEYHTKDLGEAASLRASGSDFKRMVAMGGGKFVFVFPGDEHTRQRAEEYWSCRLQVDAFTFFQCLKSIKSQIHASRD